MSDAGIELVSAVNPLRSVIVCWRTFVQILLKEAFAAEFLEASSWDILTQIWTLGSESTSGWKSQRALSARIQLRVSKGAIFGLTSTTTTLIESSTSSTAQRTPQPEQTLLAFKCPWKQSCDVASDKQHVEYQFKCPWEQSCEVASDKQHVEYRSADPMFPYKRFPLEVAERWQKQGILDYK
ncbi:unnamed protein product [Cyprideis torosa]|uniref:Uncharacterized protein n=1 Tax=Cyprideis torosa TaxID=163714 RepID=A0A7R8ZS94_9CRUS|nr:unnamed protein product [Cyprideis torosa]CAG0901075.1 unnamed protein product [Cyprideis torosa]